LPSIGSCALANFSSLVFRNYLECALLPNNRNN